MNKSSGGREINVKTRIMILLAATAKKGTILESQTEKEVTLWVRRPVYKNMTQNFIVSHGCKSG